MQNLFKDKKKIVIGIIIILVVIFGYFHLTAASRVNRALQSRPWQLSSSKLDTSKLGATFMGNQLKISVTGSKDSDDSDNTDNPFGNNDSNSDSDGSGNFPALFYTVTRSATSFGPATVTLTAKGGSIKEQETYTIAKSGTSYLLTPSNNNARKDLGAITLTPQN